MADLWVDPSKLEGHLKIPPSKSHTLRAILFAALAHGTSQIENFLPSPDTTAMMEAIRFLGAVVEIKSNVLNIKGFGGKPHIAEDVIQCGNSGQVLRFIGAVAGLIPAFTLLTGDASIRHRRTVAPLLDGMNQLGAFAVSSRGDGYAPLIVRGPFTKQIATLDGEDSQPVSGLLIAAAFAPHATEIHVTHPGEMPWIALTLDWFQRLGIAYEAQDYRYYKMKGSSQIEGFHYKVPGDFSTAAFGLIAALITDSSLTLHNLDCNDIQGDKAILAILEKMGAHIAIDTNTVAVRRKNQLRGIQIDINPLIDALPILAVLGCFSEGATHIVNGKVARKKESDRIASIISELRKMGAQIEEKEDGMIIYPSQLHGAELLSYHDHRLALSLSIAALGASSSSKICNVECIDKTYMGFYEDFIRLGAKLCI